MISYVVVLSVAPPIFPDDASHRNGAAERSTTAEDSTMKTILLAVAAGALITGTSFAQDTVQQTSLATTLAIDIAQAAVLGGVP